MRGSGRSTRSARTRTPSWTRATIECPKHGSTFDLNTGKPTTLPATQPVERFDVKVDGDDVLIEVTDD
jgi:nitrite reductase/ring-hydroxylating ferredoxin subunit